jgi:hypothetical protein
VPSIAPNNSGFASCRVGINLTNPCQPASFPAVPIGPLWANADAPQQAGRHRPLHQKTVLTHFSSATDLRNTVTLGDNGAAEALGYGPYNLLRKKR